ncbi:MAG: lipoate--protein ligase family protein [Chloroflexi bacterium]|nr:lipoate--protein ligase family protein [Chloroflexota bacterium]
MDYPHSTWRLLRTPPAPGAWNMAVDEMLLEGVARQDSLPVLRLSAWDPPCLSLGYAQPWSDADLGRLASSGWQLVRRPTGGRAILHTDELTYSVIAPPDEARLAGSLLESYRRLSQALLGALQLLHIPAVAADQNPANNGSNHPGPVCFEVPSSYEITLAGKKLIGSAQARRREGILQHGSLPLCGDLSRITLALVYPDEQSRSAAASHLLDRATTVEDFLGYPVSWGAAAEAFEASFRESLNLDLQPLPLSDQELQRAGDLAKAKYGHPDWTKRV